MIDFLQALGGFAVSIALFFWLILMWPVNAGFRRETAWPDWATFAAAAAIVLLSAYGLWRLAGDLGLGVLTWTNY